MKNFKKPIVLLLCLIITSQSSIAFAKTKEFNSETDLEEDFSEEFNFDYVNSIIENTDDFENVERDGDTITYTYADTEGEVSVIEDNENIEKIRFIEGEKCDIVEYDKNLNKLYIDGDEIIVHEGIVNKTKTDNTLSSTHWGSKFDETYKSVKFQKKLGTYTLGALNLLLCRALKITKDVSSFLSGAIIDTIAATGNTYYSCDAIYCYSFKRMYSDYSKYRNYWLMYWDPDYEDFCDSYYQDFLNSGD